MNWHGGRCRDWVRLPAAFLILGVCAALALSSGFRLVRYDDVVIHLNSVVPRYRCLIAASVLDEERGTAGTHRPTDYLRKFL